MSPFVRGDEVASKFNECRLVPIHLAFSVVSGRSHFLSTLMHVALEPVDQPDIIALIDALDAYQGALYPPESNYHLSVAELMQPNVLFSVARDDDGTALGCGAIVLLDGYGELKRMYVQPAKRGHGIAKAIITFLEREATRHECGILRLETGIHQAEALGLYERAGYSRRGPYGDYPPDPLSVFMEKKISGPA